MKRNTFPLTRRHLSTHLRWRLFLYRHSIPVTPDAPVSKIVDGFLSLNA